MATNSCYDISITLGIGGFELTCKSEFFSCLGKESMRRKSWVLSQLFIPEGSTMAEAERLITHCVSFYDTSLVSSVLSEFRAEFGKIQEDSDPPKAYLD